MENMSAETEEEKMNMMVWRWSWFLIQLKRLKACLTVIPFILMICLRKIFFRRNLIRMR